MIDPTTVWGNVSAIAQLLRQRTAATHARVEDGLALLDPALTTARLRDVLARFYGFWAGNEPVLDRWAATNPVTAAQVDWPRRRRSAALRADLIDLRVADAEVDALPLAAPVYETMSTMQALGWLYVSEGSTLGGAVITRHLSAVPALAGLPAAPLRTFAPYDEGPAPMWRSFVSCVTRSTGDDATRIGAVVDAAAVTFDALAAWLEPLMAEVAA